MDTSTANIASDFVPVGSQSSSVSLIPPAYGAQSPPIANSPSHRADLTNTLSHSSVHPDDSSLVYPAIPEEDFIGWHPGGHNKKLFLPDYLPPSAGEMQHPVPPVKRPDSLFATRSFTPVPKETRQWVLYESEDSDDGLVEPSYSESSRSGSFSSYRSRPSDLIKGSRPSPPKYGGWRKTVGTLMSRFRSARASRNSHS